MQHSLSYNESVPRGTAHFPVERYHLDARDPRFRMAYHWHVEFEIIRVLEGEFLLTWDEQEYPLSAGDMVFLCSGALHGGIPGEGCVYECLVFDRNLLLRRDTAGQAELQQIMSGERPTRPVRQSEAPMLWSRLSEVFTAVAQKSAGAPLIAQGLLLECFGYLLNSGSCREASDSYRRVNRKTEQLKRVLTRIESDYTEELTLDQLAAEAGMSSKYFCHFFQQLTRRTPIDYLNEYRIEQACCMLLSGEHSVTEAAFRCGFNDLSYFIRIFRKYKGITPGKYERSVRTNAQTDSAAKPETSKSRNSRTAGDK